MKHINNRYLTSQRVERKVTMNTYTVTFTKTAEVKAESYEKCIECLQNLCDLDDQPATITNIVDEEGRVLSITVDQDSGHSETREYAPSCKYGFSDCIHDPMYIKHTYPNWWNELGCPTECTCNCNDGEEYDDEDK